VGRENAVATKREIVREKEKNDLRLQRFSGASKRGYCSMALALVKLVHFSRFRGLFFLTFLIYFVMRNFWWTHTHCLKYFYTSTLR
jgi:hypothetical protein